MKHRGIDGTEVAIRLAVQRAKVIESCTECPHEQLHSMKLRLDAVTEDTVVGEVHHKKGWRLSRGRRVGICAHGNRRWTPGGVIRAGCSSVANLGQGSDGAAVFRSGDVVEFGN